MEVPLLSMELPDVVDVEGAVGGVKEADSLQNKAHDRL